jgi:hypothetical protein
MNTYLRINLSRQIQGHFIACMGAWMRQGNRVCAVSTDFLVMFYVQLTNQFAESWKIQDSARFQSQTEFKRKRKKEDHPPLQQQQ